MCRPTKAKFSLCTMWLQEFLARENMTGGLGGVGSPMTSRLYQFISDGTLGYNQSRKISYVDFPFPSAQIAALFIFVVIFMFPQLYISFVNNLSFACLLNFTTVACFAVSCSIICGLIKKRLLTEQASCLTHKRCDHTTRVYTKWHVNWRTPFTTSRMIYLSLRSKRNSTRPCALCLLGFTQTHGGNRHRRFHNLQTL